MDDFFKYKKINIQLFNKLLPDIVLFKLVKFISSVNDNFNEEINELENDKKDESEKVIKKKVKKIKKKKKRQNQ